MPNPRSVFRLSPAIELEILYEDAAILAVNKPAELLTSPDRWDRKRENLMGLLLEGIRTKAPWAQKGGYTYLANAHRLDFATSGVLLLGRSRSALSDLFGQFKNQRVSKQYVALVCGGPVQEEMLVDRKIGPKPGSPGLSAVGVRVCSAAETLVRVRQRLGKYALVEASPRTGRLHQVRVHLKWAGCPVLADPDYGDGQPLFLSQIKPGYKRTGEGEKPLIARTALHAEKITVLSPATGRPVTIEAPWPKDLALAVKYLRKFA